VRKGTALQAKAICPGRCKSALPFLPSGARRGRLTQQALADLGVQILELLQNLQRDFSLTYLLISHSLPVVAQPATRIAAMQGGRIVETGPAEQVLHAPAHPYTQSLIAAIPALPVGGN
jgi:ABC-type oligopeptide transport system ATPase subunit